MSEILCLVLLCSRNFFLPDSSHRTMASSSNELFVLAQRSAKNLEAAVEMETGSGVAGVTASSCW